MFLLQFDRVQRSAAASPLLATPPFQLPSQADSTGCYSCPVGPREPPLELCLLLLQQLGDVHNYSPLSLLVKEQTSDSSRKCFKCI